MKLTNLIINIAKFESGINTMFDLIYQCEIYSKYLKITGKVNLDPSNKNIAEYVKIVIKLIETYPGFLLFRNKYWKYSNFEKTIILDSLNGDNRNNLINDLIKENIKNYSNFKTSLSKNGV